MKMLDQRFGDLLATYPVGPDRFLCKCSCGHTVIVMGEDLRSGKTKDCGCLAKTEEVSRR